MKKILFLILFLAGISPVFKNNSLNLGCSQAYAQDMNGGELEEVFICSNRIEVSTSQQGDWLVEETCHLENEDGVATNPCVSICEETDVKWNPSDPSDPCIDPITGENLCDSGDPDPNPEGGGGGGSGGSGSGGSNCGSGTTCPDGYYLDETTCQCEKEPCMISCPIGYERNEDICQCVKIPCTTICDSGYELNIDTCECVLLPPCWGTIKDFETSNSFNSNTILTKLNSTLATLGIGADVIDSITQMDLFDPKTIAAGSDLVTFADNLGTIGDVGQVSMDLLKYMDEPSTQNLLRTVLDTAAIGLSPAASLALSTIDYFKDSDGNSKLDLLLKAASNAIDRSLDCNLGLGIRNSVF